MKTNDWNSLQDLRRPLMGGLARPARGRARRRGLTLTEILVASFVLAFGLTAVLTVLPFGAFQLNRMNVADMSGACGRGALQQIRMAEWQKPESIFIKQANNGCDIIVNNILYQPADPYFVDPLGCIKEVTTGSFKGALKPFSSGDANLYAFPLMTQIYATDGTFVRNDSFDRELANQYFRWNDDTVFAPSDTSSRPTLVTRSDGSTPSASGEFTWLYMVTPQLAPAAPVERIDSNNAAYGAFTNFACVPKEVNGIVQYEVATVVFHRRDIDPDPTDPYQPIRRVDTVPGSTTINTTGAYIQLRSDNADELDLTSIKWLLLATEKADYPGWQLNAQWYRITGSDDIQPEKNGSGGLTGKSIRRVFLVGPDWKGAKDPVTNNPQGTVYAILCDGVVNVFQTTMPK